jgi:hypothetical protein
MEAKREHHHQNYVRANLQRRLTLIFNAAAIARVVSPASNRTRARAKIL